MVAVLALIKIAEGLQAGALNELDWQALDGPVCGFRQPKRSATMSYSNLLSPTFFTFLLEIERDLAAQVRLLGCIACGGPLHQGHYQRKPRGYGRGARSRVDTTRFSFCCGKCRGRKKPVSVRFLGRRVYWGVIVVLATALCAGLSLRRGRQLSEQIGVAVRTIERWREWWLSDFTASPVGQALRGQFLPAAAQRFAGRVAAPRAAHG